MNQLDPLWHPSGLRRLVLLNQCIAFKKKMDVVVSKIRKLINPDDFNGIFTFLISDTAQHACFNLISLVFNLVAAILSDITEANISALIPFSIRAFDY